MEINLNLDKDFTNCINELRKKYGEKFEMMNGFHNQNLNFTDFINNFVDTTTVADVSIDANANSNTHDVRTLMSDMVKPHTKLLSFNKIFCETRKKYGLAAARKWLEEEWNGTFYLHDAPSSSFMSYCYAYDIQPIAEKGLFFINRFKTSPPKHLTTFNDHILEFISWAANRTSGAVGLPSYLVYSYYFWKEDVKNKIFLKDPEYYRRQCFQKFVYDLNQPYLRVTECAFTNITVMDRCYLTELFGGKQFPNGEYIIDYIEDIIEHQKVFMEVVSEIRNNTMMTFPVLTYSLLFQNGKFVDEDFARWCNKHNMKWCDSNFYVGNDVTSLSNCCFDGTQPVLTKSDTGISLTNFKELYDAKHEDARRNLTIFHNGSWAKGRLIRLPAPEMLRITTANKKQLLLTANHIQPTLAGDKKADELTLDDYVLFNARALNAFPERDENLSYEQGYLVGLYLGDGSMNHNSPSTQVTFSLSEKKVARSLEKMQKGLLSLGEEKDFTVALGKHNVVFVRICSPTLKVFLQSWVSGEHSFEKSLNIDCLAQSSEFRKGILEGFYESDGGNSNRIYTTSEKLAREMEALITSLGLCSIIDVADRTNEPLIIRGETFNRNYPLYTIRWYSNTNKRKFSDVYKVRNNNIGFKISDIQPFISTDGYVYCFEMADEDEPYFTLPNGIITHNCRLVSNTKKLRAFINSIGGTSLSIGSVKVNTINLRRIALETNGDKDKYVEILTERVKTCIRTLDVIRGIIKRNIEKGLLPNYTYGLIELDKQYNTIGITAMYEVLNDFGLINTDEFGNKSYSEEGLEFAKRIMNTINAIKDAYEDEYSINVEAIPAERANVVLCNKDNELYHPANEYFIYSNQWIPLMEKCTLDEKIKLGAILDKECGGGQISHINIQGDFANEEQAWDLLNYIASQGVIYFAYNKKISVCENEHAFFGETCPKCGKPKADTYCRVVGFLTPVSSWSKERKKEFDHRKWFKVSE